MLFRSNDTATTEIYTSVNTLSLHDALPIRIRDRGPGIPESLLPRVTEPFFRVESSRNRDSGGTGLGLAITKDLVESMGGHLLLRNHPDGGLDVQITVPRQTR